MYHSILTGSDVHTIITYVYSDASARNTASGFLSTDIGKIALQTDNGSYWILVDITPTWIGVATNPLMDYTTISSPVEGMIAWNFSSHVLTTYNGSSWV